MASHMLAKFGGHRNCGNGDIIILDYHVISKTWWSKHQVTLWAGAHQVKLLSYPGKFGGNKNCRSEEIVVLICRAILQDHVIKWSCDFLDRRPSREITILPSLLATDTVVMKI